MELGRSQRVESLWKIYGRRARAIGKGAGYK